MSLISCTYITNKMDTSILKVGMPGGCEVFKEDRVIVLLLKTTFYNIFITKASEYKAGLNKKYKHVYCYVGP